MPAPAARARHGKGSDCGILNAGAGEVGQGNLIGRIATGGEARDDLSQFAKLAIGGNCACCDGVVQFTQNAGL